MRLLVLGPVSLADGLRSALPGARVVRPEGGAAGSPTAPSELVAGVDAVVVAADEAASFLQRTGRSSSVPVVWCVSRGADRALLHELAAVTPSQILFDCGPGDVARALATLAPGSLAAPAAGGHRPSAGAGASAMAELWEQFRGLMVERLEVLERVGAGLLDETADADALREAHAAAHKLHGSLGTFGLARGSELAGEVEALLERGALDAGDVFRFSELVVGLRREIERGRPAPERRSTGPAAGPAEAADPWSPGALVLIVESEASRADALSAAAAARGWRSVVAATAGAALDALGGARPELALLDPAAGTAESLERLLQELATRQPPVPVLYRTGGRALDERVRAVTLGARAFVDPAATPDAVMARAALLLEEEGLAEATVLVVDDDPAVLRAVTFLLRGAGLRVRALEDPLAFWDTLESTEPDLLLLDLEMPGVSGFQLCRVTRADPRWSDLPILLLTARSDAGSLAAGFEAGADDYIVKPVVGPELVARVEGRLGRRVAAGARLVDPETGLPLRAGVLERLGVQLALAGRYDEPVAVAVVGLRRGAGDGGDGLNERLAGLAAELREAARPEDVVGRWSSEELLVARYGEEPAQAVRWLETVLTDAGVEPGAVRVGVAGYPERDSVRALTAAAAAARADGVRSGVGTAGAGPDPGRALDIVVVEDDEALGTLLIQTLDDRGYTTRWIRDGADAAALLTGPQPALRASLVILDVGLPGLDGLSLLRQLARSGVIRRTRVLMLTARAAESEVVKALELGAFDHVPKPFSVAELLHRVRRALREPGSAG